MAYAYTTRPRRRALSGVPIWERGQFVHNAGVFGPGGPGGGVTFGPMYTRPGQRGPQPGSCPQLPGGTMVCVQPPMGPRGVETGRGWPPEIGPQEEGLMDQGCVATGRQCGGSARAPGQYWCCPGGGSFVGSPFPGLVIGSPFAHGFGTDAGASGTSGWMVPVLVVGALAFVGLEALSMTGVLKDLL